MKATRWSRTTVSFAADLVLYVVIGLSLWLVVPMLILGWTPVLITSGSMSPAVEPGDVLLVERGVPEGEWFVPGTLITYEASPTITASGDAEASGSGHLTAKGPRLVTHRVDRIDADGNYVTRGDANGSTDVRPVAPDQVVGAARLLVPSIGLPVHWARDGRLLQIGLVAFALMATVLASRLDAQGREHPVAQDGQGDRHEEDQGALPDRTRPVRTGSRRRYPTREVAAPATLAARAARAARAGSGAGVAQLPDRPSDADNDTEVELAQDRRSGTTGLPPVGAVLGILTLSLGALLPSAEAAFAETSANSGNRFSTAPAPDVTAEVDIVDEWGDGYCAEVAVSTSSPTPIVWEVEIDLSTFPLNGLLQSTTDADAGVEDALLTAVGLDHNDTVRDGAAVVWSFCADRPPGSVPTSALELPLHDDQRIVDGDVGSGTTVTFEVTVDEEFYLAGPAHAELRVRRRSGFAGNSPGSIELTLSADGTHLASGNLDDITDATWHTVIFPLDPEVFGTFPAGTTFLVEVTLNRIELEVDGPSAILLAGS